MRRSAGTAGSHPSIQGGIFRDSIGVEAHHRVLRRSFPVRSFVGAQAASAALGALVQSNAAISPISRDGMGQKLGAGFGSAKLVFLLLRKRFSSLA
jgi:hypothetical protein